MRLSASRAPKLTGLSVAQTSWGTIDQSLTEHPVHAIQFLALDPFHHAARHVFLLGALVFARAGQRGLVFRLRRTPHDTHFLCILSEKRCRRLPVVAAG